MKKTVSFLLCICIVFGMVSLMVYADDAEPKTIDRVDLTITQNEVYYDIPAYECIIRLTSSPDGYVYCSLEKNLYGKWNKDIYHDEPVGAGTFRWRFNFEDFFDAEESRVVPDTTQIFIDGSDCGLLDKNYCAYSEPFEVTENDKVPKPVIIDKITVERFKAPKTGEAPVSIDDLKIIADIEDDLIGGYMYVTEYDTKGNTVDYPEVIQKGRTYIYHFGFDIYTYKYNFADNVKLYIDGDEYEMTLDGPYRSYVDFEYIMTRTDGVFGDLESTFIFLISLLNLQHNRNDIFWKDVFRDFSYGLSLVLDRFLKQFNYLFGMEYLDAPYTFYSND